MVPFLVAHGFEAVHWSVIGRASATDSEILAYAEANALVLFTHDLDFGTLLAARRTRGPSVIQVRVQDLLPEAIGGAVLSAIEVARSHLESGALVTVDRDRSRVRLLPL
jgi:predicted nuclease of predicted toxin-antitoxin system